MRTHMRGRPLSYAHICGYIRIICGLYVHMWSFFKRKYATVENSPYSWKHYRYVIRHDNTTNLASIKKEKRWDRKIDRDPDRQTYIRNNWSTDRQENIQTQKLEDRHTNRRASQTVGPRQTEGRIQRQPIRQRHSRSGNQEYGHTYGKTDRQTHRRKMWTHKE